MKTIKNLSINAKVNLTLITLVLVGAISTPIGGSLVQLVVKIATGGVKGWL